MLSCKMNNKGFTLIEVIVAIGLLSTGIVFVLQSIAFSARSAGLSNDMAKAVLLAQDKLQEIEIKEKQKVIVPGAVKDAKDIFDWEYTIKDSDTFKGLCPVTFTATWQRHGKQEMLEFETYAKR
ncbi:MAG: prepilin-type N-terminal cleavage/methylation domain-containing protein [Candidatus Omnitrophica bacterium]|nr:prepilin-type N-terminal cleavage/methylation domain-containing protein [Candidatus Omnitrophota bacterium]